MGRYFRLLTACYRAGIQADIEYRINFWLQTVAALLRMLTSIAGVAIAYDAFKLTDQGKDTTKLDGFTPDQRFFLNWAQVWRSNTLPESSAQLIVTDPHSPGMYRTNGPVSNIDAFYKAFDVKEGNKMYKPNEKRTKIW